MAWKSRAACGMLAGAALFAAFGAGYGVRAQNESDWVPPGGSLPSLNLVRTADGNLLVDAKPSAATTSVSARRTYKPNLKPYETLDEVRRAIRDNFVRTKVTDEELTYGAIRGMLRSLGDRFTRFLTPDDYAKFTEQSNAEFVGIGARIDLKDDYMGSADAKPFGASRPYIVEPIAGGPAEKNKLQKDDVILSVDGRTTADMSEDAVVSRIRGVRGTPVKLKIERRAGKAAQLNRDNAYKVFDITLTRDIIEVRPVKLEWLPNRVAWLRLDEFNKKTDAEMGEAMAALRKGPNNQGMAKGLILDMRDNPGGLLDVAVDVGSRFIPEGPIVYTRERDGSERALSAERDHFMNLKIPVVVLINNYSASAAEIVTGALKDKGIATVVGEPSYGKASVQVLLELKNGGALVITTAKYLTPAKQDISDKGIAPDVVIKASDEDGKTGRGAQLNKAVQIIEDKTSPQPAVVAAKAPAGATR